MSHVQSEPGDLAARVRRLAELLAEGNLLRLRIEREGETFEVGRPAAAVAAAPVPAAAETAPEEERLLRQLDTIKADLVGIFHLRRPVPFEGQVLEGDRELAYVEALGIRNPIRSLGPGEIVAIRAADGEPVEYGEPLFDLDRTPST